MYSRKQQVCITTPLARSRHLKVCVLAQESHALAHSRCLEEDCHASSLLPSNSAQRSIWSSAHKLQNPPEFCPAFASHRSSRAESLTDTP